MNFLYTVVFLWWVGDARSNVDPSPSLCCPPSNGWVLVRGYSTPSTLTIRETPLLSTSPLRFTFCPSRILPPMLQDPSDNFVRLRDFVDAKNCLKLAAFSKDQVGLSSYLTFCVACFLKVVQGFTEKMAEAAAKELKICKKQVNSPPA